MSPTYPDGPAGPFPEPPRTITDEAGRTIAIDVADDGARDGLLGMYRAFDPADRAQGIPPAREPALDRWLDTVLAPECVNVVARHVPDGENGTDETGGDGNGGDVVGHAMLVPDQGDAFELAIFVLADYQGAGIGTAVLETLLGHAKSQGIEHVWLTVERWNHPAIAVYKSVGFETTDSEHFELEMALQL